MYEYAVDGPPGFGDANVDGEVESIRGANIVLGPLATEGGRAQAVDDDRHSFSSSTSSSSSLSIFLPLYAQLPVSVETKRNVWANECF